MGMLNVSKTIRTTWSTAHFEDIAKSILGDTFSLSLVLIGDKKSKILNKKYRNKDNTANVLTFPLGRKTGEIFININKVQREAHTFNFSPKNHALFLFIHGCLHLKGYNHGSTMEKAEEFFLKKHNIQKISE